MTLPQMATCSVGGIVFAWSLYSFFLHRTRRFKALFWLSIGVSMIYAGFRPTFIELLGPDSAGLRLRWIVALISFIVLTVTLEAIRISRMQERYAFLWLASGLILLAGTVFPDIARVVLTLTGLRYGTAVLVVVFTFIILMLFHFSVAHSRTQHHVAQIARELALAEERIRMLERKVSLEGQAVSLPPENG